MKMTRPEVSRAFETYGRLMAKIGGIEQFMRIALGEHAVRRMTASGKIGREEMQHHANKIMKMDFGPLLHQVYTKFKLSSDIHEVLKQAKGFRNDLAHTFWVGQIQNLRSERGTAIIIENCELLERQFEKVADLLIAATGLDAVAYVNFVNANEPDEEVFRGWEVRLEAAREAEALAAEAVRVGLKQA